MFLEDKVDFIITKECRFIIINSLYVYNVNFLKKVALVAYDQVVD